MSENLSPEKRIVQLEAQLAMFVRAAKQVLSDIDDDGVGERQLSWPVDDNYLGRFVT